MSEAARTVERLLAIMARLRDPTDGCPWDREQTFESVAPYTIEEAYEVADAIARADPKRLVDELGDLLFQVVFHARIAEESLLFRFADVVRSIVDKLERRHPHVFRGTAHGDTTAQSRAWETAKAAERAAAGESGALANVPLALPALTRAGKLGRRAARVGFDWPDITGVRGKLAEELAELDAAIAARESPARCREELGDLLFTVANLARHLEIDAEAALRAANRKFERRFRRMEALAVARGRELEDLPPGEWDALWEDSKREERI